MELKLRDVANSKAAVESLLALPVAPIAKVAFALARNARHISAALDDFNKAQRALVIELGEPVEDDGGGIRVKKENVAQYTAEIDELLDQVIDLDIRAITEAQLAECEEKRPGFAVPVVALYGAWFMFEDAQELPAMEGM